MGVFVATTPCNEGTKPVPGIPVNTDAESIKWHLTLYQDDTKKTPTTFSLQCLYKSPGSVGGNNKVELDGHWSISKGTASDPNAIVYELNDNKSNKTILFLKLNDSLLHLLDGDRRLMIGTAGWSFTLNRIGNR